MLESALDEQRELYDRKYSAGWLFQWPEDKLNRVAEILLQTSPGPGARVLEYGCGRGLFANYLQRRAPRLSVCGCDISSEAVRQGRERFPSLQLDVLSEEWIERNEGAFDLIYTHHVLEHVSRLPETLHGIARLLARGGTVVHVLPCGNEGSLEYYISRRTQNGKAWGRNGLFRIDDRDHLRRLTSAELEQMCEKYGLRAKSRLFANQLWGGIDYVTGEYFRTVAAWLNPRQGATLADRLWLSVACAGLLGITVFRQGPPYILSAVRERRASLKHWLLLPFAVLMFPFSRLLDAALVAARNREWRRHRHVAGGSEMYLVFESAVQPRV